jgi:hypothetical protein
VVDKPDEQGDYLSQKHYSNTIYLQLNCSFAMKRTALLGKRDTNQSGGVLSLDGADSLARGAHTWLT